MTTVRIIVDSDQYGDLLRQTPGRTGLWGPVRFVRGPEESCNYVVISNRVRKDTAVFCRRERIWVVLWEPPMPEHRRLPSGTGKFHRVYTQDPKLCCKPFVQSQPALPWLVKRDYDYLVKCGPSPKERSLSWVTSNKGSFLGHRRRMSFLDRIHGRVAFDLFGQGFAPIDDKWDGLAPYRSSIVVENHRGPYYWSEKLADCFLAWTMPIYYGCTNITDYFPAEAMVQIDIGDRDAAEKIREAVASDRWKKNRDAIAHARDLVLNRYQLFPFLASEIEAYENGGEPASAPAEINLSRQSNYDMSPLYRVWYRARKRLTRFVKKHFPSARTPSDGDLYSRIQTRVNRGITRRFKGDLDGAIADYSRALELDPNCATAYLGRGNALRDKGHRDGAVADYLRVLALEPACEEARRNLKPLQSSCREYPERNH